MATEDTRFDELEGRELDVAVARELMGLSVQHHDPPLIGIAGPPIRWSYLSDETDYGPEPLRFRVPEYSDKIWNAWEAVEHLREQGFMSVLKHMPDDHPFKIQGSASEYGGREPTRDLPGSDGQAIAEFYPVTEKARSRVQPGINLSARAASLATAISRAALRTAREVS